MLFLSNTLRENGLAQVHFGWRHRVLDVVRRNLRWYVPISVLLLLVTAMTRLHWLATGAGFNDDHLGRSAFVLMIAVLTLFFWRVLDPRQYIDRERRGEHSLWWPTWALMGLIAMIQTALIAAALAGYYYTALYLFRIFFNSALVVIGVYLLYALALRWFMLARRHLDYRRQQLRVLEDAENRANKAAADQAGEALAQTEKGRRVDLREVSSRVQKFLRVLLGLGIVFGLAWVGQELVPLLGTVEQVTLWQHQSGEGANAVVVGVTMADLLIALAIAALTLTAARNLPGMVEVVYLERVGMKSGNRYAFTQILRYAIYVGGILWTLSAIGVGWGDVQWLVAAMGVGLGFGLKEIFGNFVSGLILLFERPIRMGDTITVGDVTGVVARIRIRATTITDWDNKELVVPNQKLITDSLVNWTLSNPITRLTFRIGVAYGSDPEEVHRIILESVQSNVLALQDPTPSVFFIGFGENALEFEIRVFVQERVQRMPLTHELNIALNKALTEQGIEIPLPQRDLHLRELTPGVLKTGTGGEGQG